LYSTLLADATFHELLLVFDQDIAIATRRGRCPLCSSVLHSSAQYRRKPRGRPAGLGEEHDWRFSFCCARDGCRARRTPPSLRFLGRKVYLAAIVVLIAIMREGATAARMRQLSEWRCHANLNLRRELRKSQLGLMLPSRLATSGTRCL